MILIDLNVVLDVVQKREPHYQASAAILSQVLRRQVKGYLPAHAFTTLHYLVARYQNNSKANQVINWLLQHFRVAGVTHTELQQAQQLGWPDFEDAVVAAAAQSTNCNFIITRNVRDYAGSPITAITPEEYLLEQSS